MEKLIKKRKISDETLLSILKADIDSAKSYFESTIKPVVEENEKLYSCDAEYYESLFPNLSKKSKFISSDIADAVEAVLADIMDSFFGSSDVISIKGRSGEDEENAKLLQDICNFQINRLNKNSYKECYDWFKSALSKDFGVLKVTWEREYTFDNNEVVIPLDKFSELSANNDVEIISHTIFPVFNGQIMEEMVKVKYKVKRIKKNQPRFENVPYFEFLFDPEARTIDDMRFCIHRKNVTASYLRVKENNGIYKDVEKAISDGDYEVLDLNKEQRAQQNEDEARKRLTIYEYWGEVDYDKDGILEPVIVTICGNTILSIQDNPLEKLPFAIISPFLVENSPIGVGFASSMKQIQNMKTALIKELAYNVAQSNDTRLVINSDFINLQDYIEGRKVIRARGSMQLPHIIFPIPFEQIHPATFQSLEYFDVIKENRSGVTRYNQGLDAKSLNKTATGINLIMQASNKRIKLIVRTIAETGIKRLFELLVFYNLKFIDNEQVIRLFNKALVTSDDFEGKFDYEVNATFGVAQRAEMLQNLNNILGMQVQVLSKFNLVEPQHIANTVKKIIEITGFKNFSDFLIDGGMSGQPYVGTNQTQIGAQPIPQGAPQQSAGGMQGADLQAMAAMLSGGMGGSEEPA